MVYFLFVLFIMPMIRVDDVPKLANRVFHVDELHFGMMQLLANFLKVRVLACYTLGVSRLLGPLNMLVVGHFCSVRKSKMLMLSM